MICQIESQNLKNALLVLFQKFLDLLSALHVVDLVSDSLNWEIYFELKYQKLD